MEQKDGGFLRITSLPIKNLESINGQGFEGDFVCIHNWGWRAVVIRGPRRRNPAAQGGHPRQHKRAGSWEYGVSCFIVIATFHAVASIIDAHQSADTFPAYIAPTGRFQKILV
jgi:hypothetical protein